MRRLQQYPRPFTVARTGVTKDKMRIYRASRSDCEACALETRGSFGATTPQGAVHEEARDSRQELAGTPTIFSPPRERKKVEMLFA